VKALSLLVCVSYRQQENLKQKETGIFPTPCSEQTRQWRMTEHPYLSHKEILYIFKIVPFFHCHVTFECSRDYFQSRSFFQEGSVTRRSKTRDIYAWNLLTLQETSPYPTKRVNRKIIGSGTVPRRVAKSSKQISKSQWNRVWDAQKKSPSQSILSKP